MYITNEIIYFMCIFSLTVNWKKKPNKKHLIFFPKNVSLLKKSRCFYLFRCNISSCLLIINIYEQQQIWHFRFFKKQVEHRLLKGCQRLEEHLRALILWRLYWYFNKIDISQSCLPPVKLITQIWARAEQHLAGEKKPKPNKTAPKYSFYLGYNRK